MLAEININPIYRDMIQGSLNIKAFLVCMLCFAILGCETDKPGLVASLDDVIMSYSGGVTTSDLPDIGLLKDQNNLSIFMASLAEANINELSRLGIDSLNQRIERMCNGGVLLCEDKVLRPGFPTLTGSLRRRLDSLAESYASQLVQPVSYMLEEMKSSKDFGSEYVFHILWSLVIDQSFYSIWEKLNLTQPGPPQVIWIVDPPHEYSVGTNFWQLPGGAIAAGTWSPKASKYLKELIPLRIELLRAAWGIPGNDSSSQTQLGGYGLMAEDGTYKGLLYRDSTELAVNLEKWRERYSEQISRLLDMDVVTSLLDLSTGQAFVILLHEIAYALFERLSNNDHLKFPHLLRSGRPADESVYLVSIRLGRRPRHEDIAMALYMKNGWHGTEEVIRLFREILASDPNNLEKRLLLGMSLFDLKYYSQAIVEFKELAERTEGDINNKRLFDWSRIWLGHVYDAMDEREVALRWYKKVVDNGSPNSQMQFGQYGIGPINAVDWANVRLKAPFSWP